MEGDHNMDMSGSVGGQVNSRWNPTKEQISMLESLYIQGVRTPSAEQIQQITSRLKAYGHIEGKNVFYWFQNHKARQRQKQKQESLAYLNQYYLHNMPHHQSLFAPPCSNVICGPCYLPQSDLGFCPQYSKLLLPGAVKRRPRAEKMDKPSAYASGGYEPALFQEYKYIDGTLPLFPLHPTGILEERSTRCSFGETSAENSITTPSNSSETTTIGNVDEGTGDMPFFDFLSGRGFCESD